MKDIYKVLLTTLLIVVGLFLSLLSPSQKYETGSLSSLNLIPVINLTFDNGNNVSQDYSGRNHIFTVTGAAKFANGSSCKYNGCLNLTATSGDYISTNINFTLESGMVVCFWLYPTQGLSGAESQAFYEFGTSSSKDYKYTEEGAYGLDTRWKALNGQVGSPIDGAYYSTANTWQHYCQFYDETNVKVYKNGVLVDTAAQSYGNLNYTVGEVLNVGVGIYGIDAVGYMDDFLVYNKTSFTDVEFAEIYNSHALGTPPVVDIYIKKIKFLLPRNQTNGNGSLIMGDLPITIDVANGGTEAAGPFNVTVTMDGVLVYNNRTYIISNNQTNLTFNYTPSYAFHSGNISVDAFGEVSEDVETNNVRLLLVPWMDRPYMYYNREIFRTTDKTYCYVAGNEVAYSSCDWMDGYVGDAFNNGWTGDSSDGYSKQGRFSAMGCELNDFPASAQCTRAIDHLYGWNNRSVSGFTSTQSVHGYGEVAAINDIMLPRLNDAQRAVVMESAEDIAQKLGQMLSLSTDTGTDIEGSNGKGFGAGINLYFYSLIGENYENAMLLENTSSSYYPDSLIEAVINREIGYFASFKNDSDAFYQEGWLYTTYAMPHILEAQIFEKKNGITFGDRYNFSNAYCGIAKGYLTQILDSTYNGNTLRNDENQLIRAIQRGDTNSYQHITDGHMLNWDIVLYSADLCPDTSIKGNLLWLREYAYNLSDAGTRFTYPASYAWRRVESQATSIAPNITLQRVYYDNANDILTFRSSYDYKNDTVLQIDGGEERGSGHSQTQGDYLYAFGEPFLDFEQVPTDYFGNDDVRSEEWKSMSVSYYNQTTNSGDRNTYSASCGGYILNQYYGMLTCPVPQFSEYPDFRVHSVTYGGDVEDYMGTPDGNIVLAMKWQPYYGSRPVEQYYVKWGDLLAKRYIVSGSTTTQIYINYINLYNEFNRSISGANITYHRNGRELKVQTVYANQTVTMNGGNSNFPFCFAKTSCTGSTLGNGNYGRNYLLSSTKSLDTIISHEWYVNTTGYVDVNYTASSTMRGLQQNNKVILFTNNLRTGSYSDKSIDGYALFYDDAATNQVIGGMNTTNIQTEGFTIYQSPTNLQIMITRNSTKIKVYVSNPEISVGIDYPQTAQITVDTQELSNYSGIAIKTNGDNTILKDSQVGSLVTFTVTPSLLGQEYNLTGGNTPAEITGEQNTDTWRYNFTDSGQIGVYNVTKIIATTAQGNTNTTYPALLFETTEAPGGSGSNITQDGLVENRTYEVTTTASITTGTSSGQVCLDINNKINYSCGLYNLSLDFVVIPFEYRFNDSLNNKTISNSQLVSILQSNNSLFLNASIMVNGTNEPENVSFDIGNDGFVDKKLPGFLGRDYLRVSKFSTNETNASLQFTAAGSKLIYMVFPNERWVYENVITLFSRTQSLYNLSFDFSTEIYKDNLNNENIWNTTSGKLEQTPKTTWYTFTNEESMCDSNGDVCLSYISDAVGDTPYLYSFMTVCTGSPAVCVSTSDAGATANNMFDNDATTYTHTWTKGDWYYADRNWLYYVNYSTISNDLNYIIECDAGGRSTSPESGSYNYLYVYNFTFSKYELITQALCSQHDTKYTYSGTANLSYPDFKNSTGQIRIWNYQKQREYSHTSGDQASSWLSFESGNPVSLFDNRSATFEETSTLKVIETQNGIHNITVLVNTTNSTLDVISAYISNDDGNTYETLANVDKPVLHTFTNASNKKIKFKFVLGTKERTHQSKIFNVTIFNYTLPFPENITIDIGDDSVYEYDLNQTVNTTVVTAYNNDTSQAVFDYVLNECDETDDSNGCYVPIRVYVDTPGEVFLGLNFTTKGDTTNLTDTKIYLNETKMQELCLIESCEIKTNVSWITKTSTDVNLHDLELDYYGNGTIYLKQTPDGSRAELYTRYDRVSVSLPNNVDAFWLFPSNANAKRVEPFGQVASKNISMYTVNLTNKPLQEARILIGANASIPSCLNITYSTQPLVSGRIKFNETCNTIGSNKLNTNSSKIYFWVDLNSCNPSTLRRYTPEFHITAVCQDCVNTTDYCN